MNIILFGGAFNPPHIGHLVVIQQALELIKADQLWILPDNIGSFGKNLAPKNHRVEMSKLLIEELPKSSKKNVKLNTTLIDENLSENTFEYVNILQKKYPQHHFSFLMGSDNLRNFKKWHKWDELLNNMTFYIYPRNGYSQKDILKNMILLDSKTQVITNFSSTIMRERAKKGLSLTNFIPKSVLNYLSTHSLY